MNYLAQVEVDKGGILRGFGKLGLELDPTGEGAPEVFNRFISSAIGLMTIIAIIWFVFLLLGGAYGVMSAGSDKAALEGARRRMFTGLVGLVVVIAAVFVIDLVGDLIGIPDILNPALLLQQIIIQ